MIGGKFKPRALGNYLYRPIRINDFLSQDNTQSALLRRQMGLNK